MAGIYGFLSRETRAPGIEGVYSSFYSSSLNGTINEEYRYGNFLFGRSVLDKFGDDRVLKEDDAFIVAYEGLFYNKTSKSAAEEIVALYKEHGRSFVTRIDGNFSGFLLDKRQNRLFLFTDHLSSKPLYLFHSDEHIIFASELKAVSSLLSKLRIPKRIDRDGAYSLLAFGYIPDNTTLVRDVTKIGYGTLLDFDIRTFEKSTERYFRFRKEENQSLKRADIIEEIDHLLTRSIKQQWEKDREYGYRHYAFMSGGLDSRVNVLIAHELGYKPISTMTFAQSGSSDQIIAEKIAGDYGFDHRFKPLDEGRYLQKNLTAYVDANDGLNLLLGSAAGFELMRSIDHRPFGSLHTGQIGDLLFGSYVKEGFNLAQAAMTRDRNLLRKISSYEALSKRYENNAELFGYEQRVIHGTFNGDRTLSHLADITSPFYNRALIEFCLSIPDRYKRHEAVYLQWFNAKHPRIADYPWEQAGVRPTGVAKTVVGRQWQRYRNALLRRVGVKINHMNPYDQWMKSNTALAENLERLYHQLIPTVQDRELQEEIAAVFESPFQHSHYGRYNKFLAVTVLLALQLHFPRGEE